MVDIARSQELDPSQRRHWIRQYKVEITGVTLPFCDIADVFRFMNERCQLLPAMKPLQFRYAKKYADADSLLTVIVAKAMNHGNHVMARTCDIPFDVLETTRISSTFALRRFSWSMTASQVLLRCCQFSRFIRLTQ